MLHGHGDDAYQFQHKPLINFSSNVSPFGINQGLMKHLQAKVIDIDHYPEPDAGTLCSQLEAFHQKGKVLVTNGATAAFYHIARAFKGEKSIIFAPAFAEYADACQAAGLEVKQLDGDLGNKAFTLGKELVFLGNPNNPDGKLLAAHKILAFAAKNQQALIVVDEAYMDFAVSNESVVLHLEEQRNLIVVKSLTKTFAVPGIRLGYILAASEVIYGIKEKMEPWSVNALALHAGSYIFSDYQQLLPDYELLQQWKAEFVQTLSQLEELEILPSSTHYFLVKLKVGQASDLKKFLVEKYSILIRDASNFEGLNEKYFRLAVQVPKNNQLLIAAIKVYLNSLAVEQ